MTYKDSGEVIKLHTGYLKEYLHEEDLNRKWRRWEEWCLL